MQFIGQVNDARIATLHALSSFYRMPEIPGGQVPGPAPDANAMRARLREVVTHTGTAAVSLEVAIDERGAQLGRQGISDATAAIKLLRTAQTNASVAQGLPNPFQGPGDFETLLNRALNAILRIPGSSPFPA